jgi:hypothetical protein
MRTEIQSIGGRVMRHLLIAVAAALMLASAATAPAQERSSDRERRGNPEFAREWPINELHGDREEQKCFELIRVGGEVVRLVPVTCPGERPSTWEPCDADCRRERRIEHLLENRALRDDRTRCREREPEEPRLEEKEKNR